MGWWNSVAAPGVNIYSTVTGGGYESGRYLMASPFVCGAAALLLSQYPELSTVELKNQIEQTAQGSGFTEELGYGVIDAAAILGELRPMAYGALKVKTNLVLEDEDDESYGVITVFSSDGVLKAWNYGDGRSHTFRLQPGDYTVTVAFYSAAAEGWELASQQASVGVDKKTRLSLSLNCNRPLSKAETGTNSRRETAALLSSSAPAPRCAFPPCQCAPQGSR